MLLLDGCGVVKSSTDIENSAFIPWKKDSKEALYRLTVSMDIRRIVTGLDDIPQIRAPPDHWAQSRLVARVGAYSIYPSLPDRRDSLPACTIRPVRVPVFFPTGSDLGRE